MPPPHRFTVVGENIHTTRALAKNSRETADVRRQT
jgi:hypothetical protein